MSTGAPPSATHPVWPFYSVVCRADEVASFGGFMYKGRRLKSRYSTVQGRRVLSPEASIRFLPRGRGFQPLPSDDGHWLDATGESIRPMHWIWGIGGEGDSCCPSGHRIVVACICRQQHTIAWDGWFPEDSRLKISFHSHTITPDITIPLA